MFTSSATRGVVLAGLLVAATVQGCVRFGDAVIGGDGAPDAAAVDVASEQSALDSGALDSGTLDSGTLDAFDAATPPDTSWPDAPTMDLVDVAPPDEAPVDAPSRCAQNDDCPDPARPLCHVATGRCVGCLTSPDTCPLRRFCDATTETCQDGCRTDDECVPIAVNDAGARPRRCDVARHTCVDCVVDADCLSGGVCVGGSCAVGTCSGAFGDCDGRADNGCETSLRSTSHCGACGRPCAVPPNAAPTCDETFGTCGFSCAAGFADCDGRADDGCEVELSRSVDHCGACGRTCSPTNGVGSCAAGLCEVGRCAAGFADCDGRADNGCEVDLRVDPRHCGSCGAACLSGPGAQSACEAGVCRTRCDVGLGDCDGVAATGCEVDTLSDASHCGGCGVACRVARGVGACRSGACAVGRCDAGFADCDGVAGNGCEVELAGDGLNCGACGRACGAGQVCAAGACRAVCAGGQTACGTSCADLRTDVANCGACGRRCGGGQVCAAGECALDCASIGETLCAGSCVRTSSDALNCGRCGNRCPAGAGATGVCLAGACGIVCASGLGDCDGSAATGCESDLANDLRHCGACGRACATANASAACAGGRCSITRCDPGYGDCDGDPGDGCETALGADPRNCGACGVVCGGGTICSTGTCVPRPGTTVITGPTVINLVRAAVNGAAGSTTLRLGEGVGTFPVGAQVLIHQTQSRAGDAGRYEVRRVTGVAVGALTLDAPLDRGYTTDAAVGARAQAVVVQAYTDLYVSAAGALTAPEWNGRFGGILAVDVAGDAVIEGQVSMDGRGFRGATHPCSAGLYRCLSGVAGESPTGAGAAGRPANGGGGGGGGSGADCGAGGGGAYGGAGVSGANGDCNGEPGGGMCATGCPNPGGGGGAAYGVANLSVEMQLGSAGGEGGGDEDGETPGGGGSGGGVVWLRAGRTVEVPGSITAAGSAGLDGNQSGCGVGDGCGMGGGGGGSGGAVRLAASTRVTLGTDRVRASGGGGGVCSCGRIDRPERSFPGGRGGVGRVGVASARVEGTTTPVFDPR